MRIKILASFIAFLMGVAIVVSVPFIVGYDYLAKLPHTYEESYYAALPLKYDRLMVDEPKIVVIGGSSVAFGVDSKLVEQELGMPCVNFGLYAAFGLKPMLDLSLHALGEGDVVVVAPELSSQMYSDYVGYDYLLQACEGRWDMVQELGDSYAKGLLAELPDYLREAKKIREMGGLGVSGVYALSSFDAYGDMVYERGMNRMDGMYSPDNLPEISADMVTETFATMINDYAKQAKEKGATVYFGICPVNELSVQNISEEEKERFVTKLEEMLDVELLASLEDHIMDAGYFYDSNFHTNEAGTIKNTVLLINDLKRAFGTITVTNISIPEPVKAEQEELVAEGVMDGIRYLVTSAGVVITGLEPELQQKETIEIPMQIENYRVVKIAEHAFAGCQAKKIVLPSSIRVLSNGIFQDAKDLRAVELLSETMPEVGNGLLDGANSELKIYVPSELYSNYVTDYFWGAYADVIEEKE